jgi:hypothetical protein
MSNTKHLRRESMNRWLMCLVMVCATTVSTHAAVWTLVDDFSSDLSNWTVYSQNSTVGITASPYTGPGGSCVQLCMGSKANKLAYITQNQPLAYDGTSTVEVAFDLGYNRIDKNGWYHGLSVLNNTGSAVLTAGHTGYRGASAGGTSNQDSFLFGTQLSPTGVRHENYTWCHYMLTMTPTQSTLKVYSWTSSDPNAYAAATPVWEATKTGGLSSGIYTLAFVNTATTVDAYAQIRDFMYVDNVYMAVPEPGTMSLLVLGVLACIRRKK